MTMAMSASAPSLAGVGGMTAGTRTFALSKADIKAKHPPIQPMPDPSSIDGKRRGFLTRHKTCGDVVRENCGQAVMIFDNLEQRMKAVDAQLELDAKSLREVDDNLSKMKAEADMLKRKIEVEEAWLESMRSGDLGKCMRDFEAFAGGVKREYRDLKQTHNKAIELLKKEFGYHPAYKRGQRKDEFTGAYYSMHPHPDKIIALG
eukprot:TRINITY_DN27790_c0_g1_i3.p1 TRINITY_DN27790_c0_g1~~TRINITY_DN27790_c0_g1_i3.p1  ORF type:complete len:204 (-),score=47.53 TRINITY_DN27790_c0_g1_i3:552-1163(-)